MHPALFLQRVMQMIPQRFLHRPCAVPTAPQNPKCLMVYPHACQLHIAPTGLNTWSPVRIAKTCICIHTKTCKAASKSEDLTFSCPPKHTGWTTSRTLCCCFFALRRLPATKPTGSNMWSPCAQPGNIIVSDMAPNGQIDKINENIKRDEGLSSAWK